MDGSSHQRDRGRDDRRGDDRDHRRSDKGKGKQRVRGRHTLFRSEYANYTL
jgi:hypothetical protein